jgi:hypothetical protein
MPRYDACMHIMQAGRNRITMADKVANIETQSLTGESLIALGAHLLLAVLAPQCGRREDEEAIGREEIEPPAKLRRIAARVKHPRPCRAVAGRADDVIAMCEAGGGGGAGRERGVRKGAAKACVPCHHCRLREVRWRGG